MTNETLAVEAFGLTKTYGSGNTEVKALRGVDLTLSRGEVIALLGPSGAGKSTLLGIIGLVNPPTSGKIKMAGKTVVEDSNFAVDVRSFRRRHMGFVFQKANLIPFLTARENVQIAMEINGLSTHQSKKRAMELMDYLGVADRADHYPNMLSGGQQQRVAVARALANEPARYLPTNPLPLWTAYAAGRSWNF